jgi:HD-like signal output (HDOD) protein
MRGLNAEQAKCLARTLDQAVELDPYLAEGEAEIAYRAAAPHLRALEMRTLEDVPGKLPVFPAVAHEAMQLVWEPESTLSALERIAKMDPVLAASVISAANSSLFGALQPINELRRAIAHLGADFTRNIFVAAAMRPFFAGSGLRTLWVHSLETAQAAGRLAQLAGPGPEASITPPQAFLFGLVHDIGRVVLLLAPAPALSQLERLAKAGCPLAAIERALFGADHAELGALLLQQLHFDPRIVEGVRFHHCPERSSGMHASMMYLAEFRCDSDEDLPSLARLNHSCTAVNIQLSAVTGIAPDLAQAFAAFKN